MESGTAWSVLRNRNFALFIFARFCVVLAIQMQVTGVGLQLYYEHGRSEWLLGLMGLSEIVPYISGSFFSGYIADFFNRKKIVLTTIAGLLGCAVCLLLFSQSSFAGLRTFFSFHYLLAIVFIYGLIRAFLAAALPALMTQLLTRQQYTKAAVVNSTVWHTASILGPVVAALMYGKNNDYHPDTVYVCTLIFFALSLLGMGLVKPGLQEKPEKRESVFLSLKTGLSFVFSRRILLAALSLDLLAVLFGGTVAILVAFNDKILHAGPEAFGWLRTAPAIGALLMGLLMVYIPPGKRAGMQLLTAVFGFGVFTILFAFCTTYSWTFFMLLMTGVLDNISVVVRHSILQLMTPDHMRGRVGAVNNIFIGSSNELGAFESGMMAELMGLQPSIVFGGAMTMVVVFVMAFVFPELRKLNLKSLQEV